MTWKWLFILTLHKVEQDCLFKALGRICPSTLFLVAGDNQQPLFTSLSLLCLISITAFFLCFPFCESVSKLPLPLTRILYLGTTWIIQDKLLYQESYFIHLFCLERAFWKRKSKVKVLVNSVSGENQLPGSWCVFTCSHSEEEEGSQTFLILRGNNPIHEFLSRPNHFPRPHLKTDDTGDYVSAYESGHGGIPFWVCSIPFLTF